VLRRLERDLDLEAILLEEAPPLGGAPANKRRSLGRVTLAPNGRNLCDDDRRSDNG